MSGKHLCLFLPPMQGENNVIGLCWTTPLKSHKGQRKVQSIFLFKQIVTQPTIKGYPL